MQGVVPAVAGLDDRVVHVVDEVSVVARAADSFRHVPCRRPVCWPSALPTSLLSQILPSSRRRRARQCPGSRCHRARHNRWTIQRCRWPYQSVTSRPRCRRRTCRRLPNPPFHRRPGRRRGSRCHGRRASCRCQPSRINRSALSYPVRTSSPGVPVTVSTALSRPTEYAVESRGIPVVPSANLNCISCRGEEDSREILDV